MKNNFYKNKKVLITGHTGFKGSWLTLLLLTLGAQVIGFSLKPNTKPSLFEVLSLKKRIINYTGDIRNFTEIESVICKESPEIIFHLAAQPLVRDSYDKPLETYDTNVMGTANLLEAIKDNKNIKSCVIITTDKVYENKEWIWPYRENDTLGGYDPYSTSKACSELVVDSYRKSFFNLKHYGTKHKTMIATARAGNVIGGGDWAKDRIVTDIIRSVFETKSNLKIRNPNAIRPWQHVLEPLYGYLLLGKELYKSNKNFSGSWNFGPSNNNFISVEKMVKKSIDIIKKGSYVITEKSNKHEANLLKLDSNKSLFFLKWNSILNIDETLNWTFNWYKDYYDKEDMHIKTKEQIKEYLNKVNLSIENEM